MKKVVRGDLEWLNQAVIFGKDTVYEHSDLREVTDPEGNVAYEAYETTYTYAEWHAKQNTAIDDLTIAILEG